MKVLLAGIAVFLGLNLTSAQVRAPELIDEFGNVPCEDWIGRLDLFLASLHNQPKSTGVIVLYEGKYWSFEKNVLVFPVFGEVNARANMIRNHFLHRGQRGNRNVTFVNGGFRDEHHIELWVVQQGAGFPKPKATRDSINYRKGKPTTIFPSCP